MLLPSQLDRANTVANVQPSAVRGAAEDGKSPSRREWHDWPGAREVAGAVRVDLDAGNDVLVACSGPAADGPRDLLGPCGTGRGGAAVGI